LGLLGRAIAIKMSRIANFLAWIVGATVSAVTYWVIVVYVLDEFNHGYGRLAWFQLSLYLSMISVLVGLAGYAVVASFRQRSRRVVAAFLVGIAFTVCELAFAFALGWAFPDRDMTILGLVGTLVIGALSAFVAHPSAA
jgi:hypothetical protein